MAMAPIVIKNDGSKTGLWVSLTAVAAVLAAAGLWLLRRGRTASSAGVAEQITSFQTLESTLQSQTQVADAAATESLDAVRLALDGKIDELVLKLLDLHKKILVLKKQNIDARIQANESETLAITNELRVMNQLGQSDLVATIATLGIGTFWTWGSHTGREADAAKLKTRLSALAEGLKNDKTLSSQFSKAIEASIKLTEKARNQLASIRDSGIKNGLPSKLIIEQMAVAFLPMEAELRALEPFDFAGQIQGAAANLWSFITGGSK